MKKIYAYIILGLVTVGVVTWLANYLSTGAITITASNKNDTITLQKTSGGGKPLTRIATGSLSVAVHHGQYTATVKNGLKTTIQVINFQEGHKTFRYSISLANILNPEPVAYENARYLETTSSQMVYLDGSSSTLYKIDNQNNLQQVGTQRFRVVKWANPSFGVGQSSSGNLYIITGSSIRPLSTPFVHGGMPVNFDVSPDKKIYVSCGADVYAGNRTGGFKKIYTASSSRPALTASINGVAVSDSKYGGNASDISKPLLAVIYTSGKKIKKNIEAERMAWSPNGQYLVAVNQSSPTIYDTALHQVTVVPTGTVVGQFTWLDDTTLLYASSFELWTYDVSSQKTQLLAGMPLIESVTGLYPSSDRSYVYVTTLNSSSLDSTIKRIGLKSQLTPDYIYKLRDILPEHLTYYSINMINFSLPPTILVQPYNSAQPGNYIQQVQAQLKSQGLDTAKLRFQLMPPRPVD